MNDLLGTLAAIFYIGFFFFVIKLIAYFFHQRRMKKLEPSKREVDGSFYYILHKGKEVCIIGTDYKMIRSQIEKIVPLYENESKIISFREGLSLSSNEYANYINGKLSFQSTRQLTDEENKELASL